MELLKKPLLSGFFILKILCLMKIKKCNNCKEDKPLEEFSKRNKSKNGDKNHASMCKKCTNEYAKLYRNKPEIKEKIKEYDKNRYEKKRSEILEQKKEYHQENRDLILEKKRKYQSSEEYKKNDKKWREENKDKLRENMKRYRDKYPMVNVWRSMLHRTLKYLGKEKENRTVDMLGYSPEDLKNHLNKMLKEDMNWENYGKTWEIDHIRPLTSFSKDSLPSEVNALSNLQPLHIIDNKRKFNHFIL